MGSDGYFYEKCLENAGWYNRKYSNGLPVKKASENSYLYFKVQPIEWRALTEENGKVLLLSRYSLTGNVAFYSGFMGSSSEWNREFQINGDTVVIYQNNYEY